VNTSTVHAAHLVLKEDFETRKDFALFVQKNVDKTVQGFFFQNAEKFMDHFDEGTLLELFEKWLGKHYRRFEWKE
jgi:hypothetical protein